MQTKQKLNQAGFSHILLGIILVVVIGVVGYSVFRFVQSKNATYTSENSAAKGQASEVKIKAMPFDIGTYDPATMRAGDILFPEKDLPEGVQKVIFSEFGYTNPGNSANNYQPTKSPQPTVYLARGTKIKAMIDGKVVKVIKLYSNDYSIHMQGEGSELVFEHEHVVNPQVKEGDQVKAGTVIATASDLEAEKVNGLALFEMGILKSGNPPSHLCMFDYLDDSIKQDTFNKINALKKSWETFKGDSTLYDEVNTAIPGCISREPISDNNNSQTGQRS